MGTGDDGGRDVSIYGGRSVPGRLIERDAVEYQARLLEVNSARIKNDFEERVTESRRGLERDIRGTLQGLVASAEGAIERARQAHAGALLP